MKLLKFSSACALLALLFSCQEKASRKEHALAKAYKTNLIIHISSLYSNETLRVWGDKNVLYELSYNDSLKYINNNIYINLCVDYKIVSNIVLRITGGKAIPIDTMLFFNKKATNYSVLIGYPAPKGLKDIRNFSAKGYDYTKYPRIIMLEQGSLFANREKY